MKALNALYKRKDKLESMYYTERDRLHKVGNNIGWGAGMRRTKCTPSFRKEDEIIEKLRQINEQIKVHPDNPYSKN